MTVNERLVAANVFDEFDEAVERRILRGVTMKKAKEYFEIIIVLEILFLIGELFWGFSKYYIISNSVAIIGASIWGLVYLRKE